MLGEFGHPPAWDSSGFGGRPMVGNPQSGLFYPPVWLAWWSASPAALGWLTVGHLLWGGLGVYVLARGQGLGRWPATVAAGTFQASPYLLAQTFEGHYPARLGGLLVSLGVLGLRGAPDRGRRRGCCSCPRSWP